MSLHQNIFQLTKWSPAFAPVSGQYDAVADRGTPLMHAGDVGGTSQFDLASNGFTGFLVNAVAAAKTVDEIILREAFLPGGPFGVIGAKLEEPYPIDAVTGLAMVALERADEFEDEGTLHLVTSGTGALTSATALQTPVTPYLGKWRVTQSGETAYFKLAAKVAPQVAANTTRYRFEVI